MVRRKLEILSIEEIYKNKLKKGYVEIKQWLTPWLKLPKKDTSKPGDKFYKKMYKQVDNFGEKINADLAVIEYTNIWYPDKTAGHNIIYYRNRQT